MWARSAHVVVSPPHCHAAAAAAATAAQVLPRRLVHLLHGEADLAAAVFAFLY